MSRSIRHIPIIGNCSNSDKPGKSKANRKLRLAVRMTLAAATTGGAIDYAVLDNLVMPHLREVSNVWDFPKDGKHYMKRHKEAWCRKYMRK